MEQNNPLRIKLIIGLGNPGKKYKNTWHNTGFIFLDKLKEKLEYQFHEVNKKEYELTTFPTLKLKLLKPLTFMNNSGSVVADYLKNSPVEPKNILIVHDDLDLSLGKFKLQFNKFPKVHNGINSIHEKTDRKNYNYLRFGIETRNRLAKLRTSGSDYVLLSMKKGESEQMNDVISQGIKQLTEVLIK